MQAVPLLSYMRDFVAGRLPRVAVSPRLVADKTAEEPAQILMGLTGIGNDRGMLAAWRNGTLARRIEMPASVLTSLVRLDHVPADRLAALGKFTVPLGGLSRGRLTAGETLVVSGASGYFGSAAVLLGVAFGAARVIATSRDRDALHALRLAAGPRVVPVVLQGDAAKDAAAIRDAAGGKVDFAFDMVGRCR
jgi:alcohol dehydrogenase